MLIFDEVKCGGTIAYGGAAERFGVVPHLAAWAKAIGGGSTIGAFGGDANIMEHVTKGAAQQGTFNGNPLSSAIGLTALTKVLTRDAYDLLGKLGTMLAEGCDRAIAETGIPAHTVDLGAKGCVSYRSHATHELSGLPGDDHRHLLGLVPVHGEPGHLHDPR